MNVIRALGWTALQFAVMLFGASARSVSDAFAVAAFCVYLVTLKPMFEAWIRAFDELGW